MHIHVLGEEGEAKFWVEPRMDLITERDDEIRTAWHEHFGR